MSAPGDGTNDGKRKKRRRDSKRFRLTAGAAALATVTVGGGITYIFGTASGSIPLTAEESAVAQSIFGRNFRTDDIRKQYVQSWIGGMRQFPTAMVPLSQRHIYFFRPSLRIHDLTMSNGSDFNTYMHEMTHIWQHRGNMAPLCRTYSYTLTSQSRFRDFCNEQQASMVGDYAQAFLNPNSRSAVKAISDGANRIEGNEELVRVVEQRFPAARASRQRILQHHTQVAACIVSYRVTFNSVSPAPTDEEQKVITHCFSAPTDRAPATTDTPVAPPQPPKGPR